MKVSKPAYPKGMRVFLWDLIKFMHLGPLMLYVHPESALIKSGWFRSFHKKTVIDQQSNPIPWWTYSFIDFLNCRLTANLRVLEFGCGGSTIWLSKRVKEVISIEDNPEWATKTRAKINSKSQIINVKNISEFDSYRDKINGRFDILIIDNLGNRMECAKNSIQYLNNEGVIIWDNTDGPDWQEIKAFTELLGFKEISFTGMIAQELSYSKTTVFYRRENCFYI